ncbi:MAG: Bax inhibitor-1/YccA family protein [Pseudomonadota bacterium]
MNDMRNGTLTGSQGRAVDEGLRQFMLGVYNYMALGVGLSGLFALFLANNQQLIMAMATTPLRWLPFVAILGIGFIGPKIIFSGSKVAAHGVFWAYAAAWGFLVAPALYFLNAAGDANIIYRAFFITATVFAGTSLFGYTTKRNLMGLGQFLFMACLGILVAIIANALIFQSSMFSLITSCVTVLIFSAVTAYETQMIKNLYEEGNAMNERTSIMGAFMLYGSFATLFIHILNILGLTRGE